MPHWYSCAFTHVRLDEGAIRSPPQLTRSSVVGRATIDRQAFTKRLWPIVGAQADLILPQSEWPNESTRPKHWVGATTHTHGILVGFVHAFFGLEPWDGEYANPNYLDQFLVPPAIRPAAAFFRRSHR